MNKSELIASLDAFTRAYITALLWSEIDDDDTPLDSNYTIDDLTVKALTAIKADCVAFQRDIAALLEQVPQLHWEWTAAEQNGHDFLLTRNGHGAGFWDRGYEGDLGDRLTDAAHKFKKTHAYVQGGKVGTE